MPGPFRSRPQDVTKTLQLPQSLMGRDDRMQPETFWAALRKIISGKFAIAMDRGMSHRYIGKSGWGVVRSARI